jgi:hypothetical protein
MDEQIDRAQRLAGAGCELVDLFLVRHICVFSAGPGREA